MTAISWQTDVIDRGLDNLSDADIVAQLPSVTTNDANADSVEDLLGIGGYKLLYRDGGTWAGPIWDLKLSDATPVDLANGIVWLTGHLDRPGREIVRTTEPKVLNLVSGVLNMLPTVGVPVDAVNAFTASLMALTGGLRYGGVTEQDVAAARQTMQAIDLSVAVADLFDRARTAAILAVGNGSDRAASIAAGQAVIDGGA